MRQVAQKLMNTPLFSYQNLKLSTKDIIAILKDTMNIILGPLPIFDPHCYRGPIQHPGELIDWLTCCRWRS
jgi:hypothetical protein